MFDCMLVHEQLTCGGKIYLGAFGQLLKRFPNQVRIQLLEFLRGLRAIEMAEDAGEIAHLRRGDGAHGETPAVGPWGKGLLSDLLKAASGPGLEGDEIVHG